MATKLVLAKRTNTNTNERQTEASKRHTRTHTHDSSVAQKKNCVRNYVITQNRRRQWPHVRLVSIFTVHVATQLANTERGAQVAAAQDATTSQGKKLRVFFRHGHLRARYKCS